MRWLLWGILFFFLSAGDGFAYERGAAPIFHVHNTNEKVIAFTFDDGPDPYNTPALLDVLSKEKVKATFFILGKKAKLHPSIIKRIAKEGHELGNHGFSHSQLRKLTPKQVFWELTTTEEIINKATGKMPRCFRSPYGQITPTIQHEAFRKGYQFIEWSIDPRDWEDGKKAKTIQNSVEPYIHAGDIVLFHDGGGDRRETIKAVRALIQNLEGRGYKFVTVSELTKRL
jgi:peptidoglycan/xylan/chitin deacetylase (PgdA/CDA1 family)